MSNILPARTIAALRNQQNVTLDIYGIDVTLFMSNNNTAVEDYDAYGNASDLTFTELSTKVFIEWKPSIYKLRKLGLFTGDDLPIICHIPNDIGTIPIGSYITVPITYLPSDVIDTDKFEIVNAAIPNLHDSEIYQSYRIIPKRDVT